MHYTAILLLTISARSGTSCTHCGDFWQQHEVKLSLDVRAGNVPVAGLWRVIWPTRRRVLV